MAESKASACITVGKGGVGESGASSFLYHVVTGDIPKLMLVKNVETSLCGNTGAIAILIVNGSPAAHGVITSGGSSIQAEAKPGDQVCVIVHTMPLFNDIACIHLGELNFELQQCDLVG